MPEFINSEEFLYANLLKTGQTTQYSSELDDGYYEKGVSKVYQVLTTGLQSNTTNIDLTHLVSTHIAFVKGTPDTLTSDTTNFTTLFVAGDVIPVSGSPTPGNNIAHTIAAGGVAVGTITLTSSNVLTSEGENASITIKKREAHSNAIVVDLRSDPRFRRRMWSQTVSGKMGTASDGKMPWTGQTYDIFAYCAAANVALLGGYGDWRIANEPEANSLWDRRLGTPNATAFPSFPATGGLWTSTTYFGITSLAHTVSYSGGGAIAKTTACQIMLVRGG